ncbi:MAG: hypothetical protein M1832_006059 [Thelocarpon impressellum]|nr:MAG: hypothetical protein M1832_006059 [Thelocarpon impressellum]
MHSSILASALFAALALGTPIKRAIVTDITVVTEVVTVTAGQEPAPTQAPPAPEYYPAPDPTPATSTPPTSEPPAPASSAPVETPASPASSSAAPATPSAPSGPAGTDYKSQALFHHNCHRANHSSPDLVWDDGLASAAQIAAESCVFEHKMNVNGLQYGQNLASGNSADAIGKSVGDQFYNGEVGLYPGLGSSNPDMSNFKKWGHMSQVVWKATTKVGCHTAACPGLSGYTVCNYGPAGNSGDYGSNVLASLGLAPIAGSASS